MPKTPNPLAEGEEEGNGEREEAEDDAPEAVQAQNQSSQQSWSTYPDLLRVQRSKSRTNPVVEEHPPEGQEPGSSRPRAAAVPQEAQRQRETGTIPKRVSRPTAPPDLTSRRADVPRLASSSQDGDVRPERLVREVDQLRTEQRCTSDEAKEAELRDANEVQVQLATIAASVHSLIQVIQNLSQSVNERLDHLDARINNLVTSGSAVTVDTAAPLRSEIISLIHNQRREIAQERRLCMNVLADALRTAVQSEVKETSTAASAADCSKQNGPN